MDGAGGAARLRVMRFLLPFLALAAAAAAAHVGPVVAQQLHLLGSALARTLRAALPGLARERARG